MLSTCKRLKVGCVILRPDWSQVYAIGYNGLAAGEDNDGCRLNATGDCGCIHAEANALVKLATNVSPLLMLVTHAPCWHCAGLIVNSRRIYRVVWGSQYRDLRGLKRLEAAGITTYRIEEMRRCASYSSGNASTRTATRQSSTG